ncbi:phospholipase D-like domain-containing protein [Streptomyces sp. NPDC048172]|uniref:phospholipase D-like domain-containing protein n=1 Tax=Streptomyces sp. NPDC048172 TaxID=3365505 RepID=UPI003724830D
MIKRLLVMLCAAAVVIGLAGAAPAPKAPRDELRTQAVLNHPHSADGKDDIVEHLVELIDGAAKNSKIRVAMYEWEGADSVVNALVKAHEERDVTVQVLSDRVNLDDQETPRTGFTKLRDALGKGGSGSWARYCGDEEDKPTTYRHACIGSSLSGEESSMHNKFFLFTRTQHKSWVVSNGTSNMRPTMQEMWNSQYTEVGNHHLYDRYLTYFNALTAQKKNPNYYDEQPPEPSAKTTSYHFPRDPDGPDPVEDNLKKVRCPDTLVRVGVWKLSRLEVAAKLKELAILGCNVSIVANHITPAACEILTGGAEVGVEIPEIRTFREGKGTHQKNILISGNYLRPGTKAIFTGSANLDYPSLNGGDENIMRILNNDEVYEQFAYIFGEMKADAKVLVENSRDCSTIE